jgi:lysophospholipase L1-like esterase
MNYHKRVLQFVLIISISLFLLSIFTFYFNVQIKAFQDISILSDVLKSKDTSSKTITSVEPVIVSAVDGTKQFSLFTTPEKITAYYADSNNIALKQFIQKLDELKKGKRKKIRIAYLGDSMIEDDFISLTLRRLMQHEFGGYGVGCLPLNNGLGGERTTANINASDTWVESNFRNNPQKKLLFISGRNFNTDGSAYTEIKDKTSVDSLPLNKYLLYGSLEAATTIQCNNIAVTIPQTQKFNAIIIDSSRNNNIRVSVNAGLTVFGISLESPSGVIVDNFSFRGNSGNEFAAYDSTFLQTINKLHSYDLIIMQYGVNLFEKASDVKFDWYYTPMRKSVAKLKSSFTNADIILMGCADRSFRYGANYETAKGLPNIIALQQKIAYENGIHFYNTFSSMGGEGSMANWVSSKPPLAYKDYMHPNAAGSEVMGKSLFSAIMNEYHKFQKNKK